MSKISQFLKEVQSEFKNITWPKKEALIQLSIVVISFSVAISLILGGFDYLFTQSFQIFSQLKPNPVVESGTPLITFAPSASESGQATPSATLSPSPTPLAKPANLK